ncbi:hypothetical protein ABZO31_08970 [Streptomyces sp. HUAS MG47]|uniref:hypothetical protein n=1 Tax=Streptomyces solicamelliae TaxID=3231716 RepID=UPI0038781B63
MALLSAVAALLGVLLVCPDIVRASAPHHERAAATPAAARNLTATARTLTAAGPPAAPAYVCPYDRGDCRLLAALGPAVLTAPPLDPPVHAAGPAAGAGARDVGGRTLPADARPRAPDLHVLQVLRS